MRKWKRTILLKSHLKTMFKPKEHYNLLHHLISDLNVYINRWGSGVAPQPPRFDYLQISPTSEIARNILHFRIIKSKIKNNLAWPDISLSQKIVETIQHWDIDKMSMTNPEDDIFGTDQPDMNIAPIIQQLANPYQLHAEPMEYKATTQEIALNRG